ncbi:mannose-1-phosphate guanyltransferase [Rhizophlyctis rosea]|nr:mannose-1-phosphate guanyltransferase [Rhizophlyctis rosea]
MTSDIFQSNHPPPTVTSGASKPYRSFTSRGSRPSHIHPTAASPPQARRHDAQTSNPYHQPRTTTPSQQVYVLTLNTSPSISNPLNQLRTQYFPTHLNRTPAHITFFHALPHSEYTRITNELSDLASTTPAFAISTGPAFRLRKGVAIPVDLAGGQIAGWLHDVLQGKWTEFLSDQDRQALRPHWTVQNKVDDEGVVRATFETVKREFEGANGMAVGLTLWKYLRGGRWEFDREFKFEGTAH